MIAAITAVDKFLEAACMLKPFRWLLVVIILTLAVVTTTLGVRNFYLANTVKGLKGEVTGLEKDIETQNGYIAKAGEEKKAQDERIAAAGSKSEQLRREAAAWRKKALETPLTGSCENMVDQVIQSVKQQEAP